MLNAVPALLDRIGVIDMTDNRHAGRVCQCPKHRTEHADGRVLAAARTGLEDYWRLEMLGGSDESNSVLPAEDHHSRDGITAEHRRTEDFFKRRRSHSPTRLI